MLENFKIDYSEGVITFKNHNTTIGFIRYNGNAEIEYLFVNPMFRRKGFATKLINLVEKKTGKKPIAQEPISPMGIKFMNSIK